MFPFTKTPPQKCNCCEKKLKKTDKNKSKGFWKKKYRRCDKCNGKVCRSCGLDNICHECIIKETIPLDPDALMQTDRKTLLSYLTTLHCNDYAFQTLDSKYLVKQILTRYSVHEDWDPATVDYSPPQLRRSKIQQQQNDPPKPQPAARSRKNINNVYQKPESMTRANGHINLVDATQHPDRNPVSPGRIRKGPNILPLRDIRTAAYFDTLSIAELKYFLQEHSVSSVNVNEKQDLKRMAIEIWRKFCQNQIRSSSMIEYNKSINRVAAPRQRAPKNHVSNQHQQPPRSVRVPSLRTISSPREIDALSFDELVIILHKHNINPHYYKSTVEMANQVKMLWSSLVRRPADQQNDLGYTSVENRRKTPYPNPDPRSPLQEYKREQDLYRESRYMYQKPIEPEARAQEKLHKSHQDVVRDNARQDHREQHYANYDIVAHHSLHRGTNAGSVRQLYPEVDAINDRLNLHQATFVPEVHNIPMQTVQVEHLSSEPVSLQDFDRPEEIAGLSVQELVELLEQHNVSYSLDRGDNKKTLVEKVTRLWLGKKGPEAIADDIVARVRASTYNPTAPFPEATEGVTNNAFHGQVLRNKKEITLSDITSPGDIEELSNAQLKHIMLKYNRSLDYYAERRDLVLEVRLLWDREQKQQIEGKTVGRNTSLEEQQHYEQTESTTVQVAESLNRRSSSIKKMEELRRNFFRTVIPPPIPSPRASLQRETSDKSNDNAQEVQHYYVEEPLPKRSALPPTPPVRDYSKTITTVHPETSKTVVVQMARIEPFVDRQESTVVKTYIPVYPRDREISRSQSTVSENDILKVQNIGHFSKNVSLADIRAPEEIQEMPVRDIRMLLEKYDVEIYPGAEKGHLIELVTKLWDKRQTQGTGQYMERFKSFRSKSSEVVYAQIVHTSDVGKTTRSVQHVKQLDAQTPELVTKRLSMVQSLEDISSPEIVNKLTSRQMKTILSKHAVDFSAFTERAEMARCLINLWHDERNNDNTHSRHASECVNNCCLCKKSDQIPDCVFLNCGHMIMCMDCGSKTKECPKCRQYIVRVVRVFKS